jgi:hypothetical protein
MSKVMFFAHDPGGANAIAPLVETLNKDHEILIFAKGPALLKLPGAQELPAEALRALAPDMLITGTSANDRTEHSLWREARLLGIKSMAILDHWINYGIRFSKHGLKEIGQFHKDPDIFPDFIAVMDDFAKEETIKEGVPGEIIRVLGNPHFEYLRMQACAVKNVRASLADKKDLLVVFLSEPYTEDYGQGNEKQVLKDLMDFAQGKRIKVMIKLHPKEKREKYLEYPDQNIVPSAVSMAEVLAASDLIVSMTSMGLIEAWVLGKRILSYQPGERDNDKFILTRRHAVPFINNKEDLYKNLELITKRKQMPECQWTIDLNGIRNNARFIHEVLCPN